MARRKQHNNGFGNIAYHELIANSTNNSLQLYLWRTAGAFTLKGAPGLPKRVLFAKFALLYERRFSLNAWIGFYFKGRLQICYQNGIVRRKGPRQAVFATPSHMIR
jgi:hypothetical protein